MEEEKNSKLKDLLESTHPILQDFRDKCPGSFKHSQSLVGMIEAVAIALDLDVDKMKVAALYHDIGKVLNPKYFSENQDEENPHDLMEPEISYQIITRHVSDSVMILLNEKDFPRDIIEIISRHHGSSILKYFFDKSKTKNDEDFRYKTHRPETVEDAVLMITDCVDAKVRSLFQANKLDNDTSKIVNNITSELFNDGQFDNVTMRLGDLNIIKLTLEKELSGIYQKRVEYPDLEKKKPKKKNGK